MTRMRLPFLTFATLCLALALMRPAAAEQGCPDGYTMAPTGTAQCVPIPGLYQVPKDSQSDGPPVPQVRWEARWGAIAMDNASGKTAVAGSQASRQQAESAAVALCQKKGGGDCRVRISYANQCGVMAWGNGWSVAKYAPTLKEASEQALSQCQKEIGATCEIFFSDCSMPVRVQ
ncbi:DUF4189 domain-containing protein [Achromobacter sp. UMC71]|uniref:DUF4189 domain-containing protein n=1 Tax=Achromobacter sp. UMC71 TaxID=1862320 RepID=UPI0016032AA6|nr:DUF4189 domain-containing protein [Achromobacter sp. UMC71]MBB1627004.1 hypothetical protein [Achromobacter sp. UMC71]